MAAPTPAIAIKQLRFDYRADTPILDIGDLLIQRGERVFLHGPSGTGKTTLLGILAGILALPASPGHKQSSGSVSVLGTELAGMAGAARDRLRGAHIGYIFQMFNLIPYLNVSDNITLPLRLNAMRAARLGTTSPRSAATELAAQLGLANFLNKPVTELSVGQQQRVAAARALIGAPELIIADEPTSALDYDQREAFLKLLFTATSNYGGTVLFVSHDRSLAGLFDRVVALRDINKVARAW